MRIVNNKIEFYIKCKCGLELAYPPQEESHKYLLCPKCKTQLQPLSSKLLISTVQEIGIDESQALPSE